MSEFENTVTPIEETSDLEPITATENAEENVQEIVEDNAKDIAEEKVIEATPVSNDDLSGVLPKPINILDITKKYRKIIIAVIAAIVIVIALFSIFSSDSTEGETLFADDMLIFTEINVETNTKMYGIINKEGDVVIDADFTDALIVGDGMIVAQDPPMGDNAHASSLASYGLIDSDGEEITKFSYSDHGFEFSDGLLPMAEDGKWGFIDKDGKWIIEPKFDYALSFSEKLAGVKDAKSRKYGFIDKNGKWVIKAQFEDVGSFGSGIAPAKLDGKWGFVDKDGNWVIKNSFLYVKPFCGDIALAQDINENWGTINEDGEWIIKPRFQEIKEFSEDVAAAKKNGKWGFIGEDGKWVIENDYYDAGSFVDGLAYVKDKKGGKYGYINDDGDWKIKPQYNVAYDFSQGLACVKSGKKYGYIDKKGNNKIDFQFNLAKPFYADGYAIVCIKNNKWYIIDETGKSVFADKDTFDGLVR